MKRLGLAMVMAAGTLLMTAPAFPEATTGQGQAVVTVLPKMNKEAPVKILPEDLQVKLNGKESSVTDWVPLRGVHSDLELVVLIDDGASSDIGSQLDQIADFINSLPANVKVGVGYMKNGRAAMGGPLSTDHPLVARGLHLPGGGPGSSGSPYFCLSDLAQHWPSSDHAARHEVVLITDGVDNYSPRFDPDDPYVQAAINDSARAGLVVYSIYWPNRGRGDNSFNTSNAGQSLLAQVTEATGGASYWMGSGPPVSFKPYFEDIALRLRNQYRLSFASALQGKPEVQNMALKVGGPAAKVYAPQQVFVTHPAVAEE
ncbi:MAG: hypothetical protein WBM14_11005 [Terracidiphilus sp.]|jgi:hypothetical protein